MNEKKIKQKFELFHSSHHMRIINMQLKSLAALCIDHARLWIMHSTYNTICVIVFDLIQVFELSREPWILFLDMSVSNAVCYVPELLYLHISYIAANDKCIGESAAWFRNSNNMEKSIGPLVCSTVEWIINGSIWDVRFQDKRTTIGCRRIHWCNSIPNKISQ